MTIKRQVWKSGLAFIVSILCAAISLKAQQRTWLDEMREEHSKTRMGYGLQLGKPNSILVQAYKGAFCSGKDQYIYLQTFEFFAGADKLFPRQTIRQANETLRKNGLQVGMNYLLPMACLRFGRIFTFQAHLGMGLQGGRRIVENNLGTTEDISIAGNGMARLSITGKGFAMNRRYWFVTAFTELKYHREFNGDLSGFRPGIGLVIRKVR